MTEQNLIRWLWIGVALSMPMFGVASLFHFDIGLINLSPPTIVMAIMAYFSCLTFWMLRRQVKDRWHLSKYRTLFILLLAFLLLHILSAAQSAVMQSVLLVDYGIRGTVKVVLGFFIFWMTIALFPRDEKFLSRFFLIACWGCSILLAFFIYRYAFVFHMPFLSTEYSESSREGKNQMAVQTAYFFFYAFSYLFLAKKKWLAIMPVLIFTIAIIYLGSRMGWMATCIGLLFLVGFAIRRNMKVGLKLASKIVVAVGVLGMTSITVMANYIDFHEITVRLTSLYKPSAISEIDETLGKNSYSVRTRAVIQSFEAWSISPIIGLGVGNTGLYVERITHNDFATILLEMGLVGELLFLGILITAWRRKKSLQTMRTTQLHWLSLGSRAGLVALIVCLNCYNFYRSPYFWFYLALFIVTLETVEGSPNENSYC